jgi:hypothetical protein
MPFYEFYCAENHRVYTFFARSMRYAQVTPRCPDNPDWALRRKISRVSYIGNAKEPGSELEDDPRLLSLMADMERDFAGMDEENPDPRQLAKMMRKMSELTGDNLGEGMEEMIRRLERGEDPNALEEEMGDLMGDDDAADLGDGESLFSGKKGLRNLLKRRQQPVQDERVFNMEDYADVPEANTPASSPGSGH